MKISNHIHYLFLVLLTSVYAAPHMNIERDPAQACSPPFPSVEEHPLVQMHGVVDATRILKRTSESIEMTTFSHRCKLRIASTYYFDVSTVDKGFIQRIINKAVPSSLQLSGWAELEVPDQKEWKISSDHVDPPGPIVLNVKLVDGHSGELILILSREHPEENYIVFDSDMKKPLLENLHRPSHIFASRPSAGRTLRQVWLSDSFIVFQVSTLRIPIAFNTLSAKLIMRLNILYLVFILATAMCTTSHPISNIRSRASLYPVAPRPRGLQGRADHADSSAGSTRKPKWIDVLFDEEVGQRDESLDSEVFEFLSKVPALHRVHAAGPGDRKKAHSADEQKG
ncbi:hypothetical protein EV360DRAFT_86419 [Lentinula raphanica]|nr:hypothetical protein EV360DRAFT_86419 [Lentinula raphanica]